MRAKVWNRLGWLRLCSCWFPRLPLGSTGERQPQPISSHLLPIPNRHPTKEPHLSTSDCQIVAAPRFPGVRRKNFLKLVRWYFLCVHLFMCFPPRFPIPWSVSLSPVHRGEYRCRSAVVGSSFGFFVLHRSTFCCSSSLGASLDCLLPLFSKPLTVFSPVVCSAFGSRSNRFITSRTWTSSVNPLLSTMLRGWQSFRIKFNRASSSIWFLKMYWLKWTKEKINSN